MRSIFLMAALLLVSDAFADATSPPQPVDPAKKAIETGSAGPTTEAPEKSNFFDWLKKNTEPPSFGRAGGNRGGGGDGGGGGGHN